MAPPSARRSPLLLIAVAAVRLDRVDRFVGWSPLLAQTAVTILVALVVAIPRRYGMTSRAGTRCTLAPVLILVVALLQPTGQEVVESTIGRPSDPTWRPFWLPNPRYEQAIAGQCRGNGSGRALAHFFRSGKPSRGPFRHVGYGGIGHPADPYGGGNYQSRRMVPAVQALLVSGRPIFLDLYEIQGYNPIQLRRYVEFMAVLNGLGAGLSRIGPAAVRGDLAAVEPAQRAVHCD